MKAVSLLRDGFEVVDVSMPVCPLDGVLVKTLGCGICGGDLTSYKSRNKRGDRHFPGHEGSGVIVEVGANVKGFKKGDKVTSIIGGYCEYFIAKPHQLVPLTDNVKPQWALGEPLACCVHAVNRTKPQHGDHVAVIGCGFMGMVCMKLMRLFGAGFICAIDPISWKQELALKSGADVAYSPVENCADNLIDNYGEFDIVIEAAGSQDSLDLCDTLVKQHGIINLVGFHKSDGGKRFVNMATWNYKAIDVVNGHVRRLDEKLAAAQEAMTLLNDGALRIADLVSYYPLTKVKSAFDDLIHGKEGVLKVVLIP